MERQRLNYLLDQYINDQASAAELLELGQYDLTSKENLALLTEIMEKGFAQHPDETGLVGSRFQDLAQKAYQIDKKLMDAQDLNSTSTVSVHRLHFLRTAWFRYAAVLLLIVGTATFLYINYQHPTKQLAVKQSLQPTDILPGGNKAILTLADGSRIVLDSAATGNLARQGTTNIIKLNAGALAYQGSDRTGAIGMNTISTPRGGQYQIILPDGSKVWLNAESSIKFPTAFTGSVRQVEMTGEAYMEIVKNPGQPFTVTANGTEIQVLGTSFNVNAYSNETAVKTTLINGSVRVISKFNTMPTNHAVVLHPGQQAIVGAYDQQLTILNDPAIEQILAWKEGLFNFTNADLPTVVRQLERWYDIKVKFENAVPALQISGEMKRGVKLSTVLNWFSDLGINTRLEGKTLMVL